jgi:hypothetical protein
LNFVFVATPVIHLISHRYWIKTALATAFWILNHWFFIYSKWDGLLLLFTKFLT